MISQDVLGITVPESVPADAEHRLATGKITVLGRMPNASNATFLVQLVPRSPAVDPEAGLADDPTAGDDEPYGLAIYKPGRGERPLWDFPPGLYKREVAAYVLSRATGLDVIPPTTLRADAPLGEGSLQWFVNADFAEHYFSLAAERPDLHDQLRAIAVFDIIANNTDRKSGHCLFEPAAPKVWGIDNGLCFGLASRLRTVIWDFSGEPLGAALRDAVARVTPDLAVSLDGLLLPDEVAEVVARAEALAATGTLPFDNSGRAYPWPLV